MQRTPRRGIPTQFSVAAQQRNSGPAPQCNSELGILAFPLLPPTLPFMSARLYDCEVMHARLAPREHRFTHSVFTLAANIQNFAELGNGLCLLGPEGSWAPYQLRDGDYLPRRPIFHPRQQTQAFFGQPHDTLPARARAFAAAHGYEVPATAQLTLIALPRAFGKSYNPVSFILINQDGQLMAAIAEVHNTFGERKAWFLGPDCRQTDGSLKLRTPKQFYVSPFSGLDTEFEFILRTPDHRLILKVDHWENGTRTLVSAWTGQQVPLTDLRLAWLTLRMPFLIFKVITLIHLHALWLWLVKRLPFRRKKDDPKSQVDLRDPSPETPDA